MRFWAVVAAAVAIGVSARSPSARALPLSRARDQEAVRLEAATVPWVNGAAERQLSFVACRPTCAPIPWQLDERDASGQFVLDHGESTNLDDAPGIVDENDLMLFMADDVGDRVPAKLLSDGVALVTEIEVSDPRSARRGWVYLLRYPDAAPRSSVRYVRYDPAADRLEGAQVALGFDRGTPRTLALSGHDATANLLDRMKVRASASFLWGLFSVRRNEDDVLTLPVAWHEGPIRILRRQRFWIRLSWRWRTPVFVADTFFYRDFAEMPVALHLNFTPRLLFADVAIRVSLDFRDLDGWELETPGNPAFIRVDGRMTADKRAMAQEVGEWFALHGPNVTLLQVLTLSPSLRGLRPRLYYRDDRDGADPPESYGGAVPDIGYTLTAWDQVSSGDHWFAANAYALRRDQSVSDFLDGLRQPLCVTARELPVAPGR